VTQIDPLVPRLHPVLSSAGILRELEDESIEILRETAATFRNPVLLYSIGKDSTVILHLARKAFYPAPIPFPLLHVDSTWNFKEMITFRDHIVAKHGLRLIAHINEDGLRDGITPFSHGISEYIRVMNTLALKQALDKYEFDAAIGGSRRDEERSRAKERIFSVREPIRSTLRRNDRWSAVANSSSWSTMRGIRLKKASHQR